MLQSIGRIVARVTNQDASAVVVVLSSFQWVIDNQHEREHSDDDRAYNAVHVEDDD
jgi:hypothetical protein